MKKLLSLGFILIICALLGSCSTPPPSNPNNICNVFEQYPSWYWAAKATRHKYGVPISVQMAIIHQESHFRADAKPPREYLLWVIPWGHVTSAYGYSQATDGTWAHYIQQTGHKNASRRNFDDASDFIGWYAARAHKKLWISKRNAYALYLAYHEGINGYKNRTYRKKRWLIGVANKVQSRADMYYSQLIRCEKRLPQQRWWRSLF